MLPDPVAVVWGIGDVDVHHLIDTAEVIDGLPLARTCGCGSPVAGRPKARARLRLLDAWEAGRRG